MAVKKVLKKATKPVAKKAPAKAAPTKKAASKASEKKTVATKKKADKKGGKVTPQTRKPKDFTITSENRATQDAVIDRFYRELKNAGVKVASKLEAKLIMNVYQKTLFDVTNTTSYYDPQAETLYRRTIVSSRVTNPPKARGGLQTLVLAHAEVHFNRSTTDIDEIKYIGRVDKKNPDKFIVCEYDDPEDTENESYHKTGEVINISEANAEQIELYSSLTLDTVDIVEPDEEVVDDEEDVVEEAPKKKTTKSVTKKKAKKVVEEDEETEDTDNEDEFADDEVVEEDYEDVEGDEFDSDDDADSDVEFDEDTETVDDEEEKPAPKKKILKKTAAKPVVVDEDEEFDNENEEFDNDDDDFDNDDFDDDFDV